jgi:hypothetical protein
MAQTEMIQTGCPLSAAQPNTPPSSPNQHEHVVTLNNVQQFIDMVKAVVAMEIASTPLTNQSSSPVVTTEHVQQILDILKSLATKQDPPLPPPAVADKLEPEEPKGRASTLEFKKVNEVYVYARLQSNLANANIT